MNWKYSSIIVLAALALAVWLLSSAPFNPEFYSREKIRNNLFEIQSIDTMKYSRDLARAKAKDPSFDKVMPMLSRWVRSARAHGLSVWFRGNFSGWEGWFSYPKIGRAEHLRKLEAFIKKHPKLFESGDIFTPCPECENGGPGDPRNTGDKAGYRKFLIDEFALAKTAFNDIGKSVGLYASMNGDIARYVMDSASAESLGGGILVDHYVP